MNCTTKEKDSFETFAGILQVQAFLSAESITAFVFLGALTEPRANPDSSSPRETKAAILAALKSFATKKTQEEAS